MNTIQKVKVLDVRHLTEAAFVLKLERQGFEFVPGQCVNIGIPGSAVNREYSTYSGLNDDYLEFLIKKVLGGNVSNALSKLSPGDEVTLDGAYGLFTLEKPEDANRSYFFIGSGTGIAPFRSYIRSYPGLNYKVLHGVHTAAEQYDRQDYAPGRYVSCISTGNGGDFSGRVTDYLKSSQAQLNVLDHFYLCGNSSMINDVYDILRKFNVSGSHIYTEVFF